MGIILAVLIYKGREPMIDEIDVLGLEADLAHSHCELNHGPRDTEPHRAVDYLVLPVGKKHANGTITDKGELVIPVCQECLEGLTDEAWTLLYCIDCNESQWVARQLSKMQYRHNLIWLRGCPRCSAEFGGIYFNDPESVAWDLASRKVA